LVVEEDFFSELAAEPESDDFESDDFELLPESPDEPFVLDELSLDELSLDEPDPFDAAAGTVLGPLRLSVR
jgi:hypothetical protein